MFKSHLDGTASPTQRCHISYMHLTNLQISSLVAPDTAATCHTLTRRTQALYLQPSHVNVST